MHLKIPLILAVSFATGALCALASLDCFGKSCFIDTSLGDFRECYDNYYCHVINKPSGLGFCVYKEPERIMALERKNRRAGGRQIEQGDKRGVFAQRKGLLDPESPDEIKHGRAGRRRLCQGGKRGSRDGGDGFDGSETQSPNEDTRDAVQLPDAKK